MALPIAPTPGLKGKDAKRFLQKIEEGLKHPTGPVPTPRLEEARRKVLEKRVEELEKALQDMNSALQNKNSSGCACVIDDNGKLIKICRLHAEWAKK